MKKPLITEIDNVETKRVLQAMDHAYIWLNAVAIIIIACSLPFLIQSFKSGVTTGAYILLGIFTFLYLTAMVVVHTTYKPMLETAKLNDKIRHEEKVRFAERDKHDLEQEIERLKQELDIANKKNQDLK